MARIEPNGTVVLEDGKRMDARDYVEVADLAELVTLLVPPPPPQTPMIPASVGFSSGGGRQGIQGPIGPTGPAGPAGPGGGGWTDDGTTVRLTTATDQVAIGAAVPFGAEKLLVVGDIRVESGDVLVPTGVVVVGATAPVAGELLRIVGDARIEGKLTVTGAIDPTSVLLSGSTALFFESNDGSTAPVSGGATGRIRYNDTTGTWQVSTQASAYVDIATGAGAGGWQDDGTIVRLSATTDSVNIGGTTDLGKFTVQGDADEIQLRVRGNAVQTSNLVQFETSAPGTVWSLTNGGATNQTGAFSVSGTTVFEADRDLAVNLVPNATATLTLGTTAVEFSNMFLSGSVRLRESADPVAVANTGFVYTKDIAGVTQLFYIASDSTVSQLTPVTAGGGGWTDDGTTVRLTTSTDEVVIGSATAIGKFSVVGDASQTLVVLRAAAVGTNDLLLLQDSAGLRGGAWNFDGTQITLYQTPGGANATIFLDGSTGQIALGPGTSGADVSIFRGAANRLDLASGDSLNIVLGSFQIAATTIFESDRDVAINLVPNADGTLEVGSTTRQWNGMHSREYSVRATAGDANPTSRLASGDLRFGPGGAGALDVRLFRSAADELSLASGDSFFVEGSYIQMAEIAAPAAPAANRGRIYMEDNGAGKTRLAVIFNTGAAQIIATEP